MDFGYLHLLLGLGVKGTERNYGYSENLTLASGKIFPFSDIGETKGGFVGKRKNTNLDIISCHIS